MLAGIAWTVAGLCILVFACMVLGPYLSYDEDDKR